MKMLGIALLAHFLSACTIVHVHSLADASIRTHRHIGLLKVDMDPGLHGSLVLKTSGVGAAQSPTGVTIGIWKETLVLLGSDSDCRTVIWVEDRSQLVELERILKSAGRSLQSLCLINEREE